MGMIRDEPLIIVGGVGKNQGKKEVELTDRKKGSTLTLEEKKASAPLRRKKCKCLVAEEKKVSEKSVSDTPLQ